MPCSDGRDTVDREQAKKRLDDATRVACELARMLTLEQLQSVSQEAALWISEHFKLDEQRRGPKSSFQK